ncbi:alpha/beta hydrolase [Chitinimonas naiadis]
MSLVSPKQALLAPMLAAGMTLAAGAEPIAITTPRGAALSVLQDIPEGAGPFPVLILAPGQGYHMQMPLLERLSASLRDRGVAVLRFNWAYYTQQPQRGEPAQDLATEVEDMQAVLGHARQDARFDPKRIMAGGKSLGSLVTWRLLTAEPALSGGLLLTPVCSSQEDGGVVVAQMNSNYPDLAAEARPLALIAGEQDPYCYSPVLYQYAGSAGRSVRVSVLGGNHSFHVGAVGDKAAEAQSERNIDLAVTVAADFVQSVLIP